MNRNQYLKEVCTLVKELGLPKSEVIRVCALKKDALEVEYNKLIALKNAPVAVEAPVEVIEEVVEVAAPVNEVVEVPAEAFTFQSATFSIGCNVNKAQRKPSPQLKNKSIKNVCPVNSDMKSQPVFEFKVAEPLQIAPVIQAEPRAVTQSYTADCSNDNIEVDNDRDFGRWGHDDEVERDSDDDFDRYENNSRSYSKYNDRSYSKYNYNDDDNDDILLDDIDVDDAQADNIDILLDDIDDDDNIDADDKPVDDKQAEVKQDDEPDNNEVITVDIVNNATTLTLNDLPAPTINIKQFAPPYHGFSRLHMNDKSQHKASPFNMHLMSVVPMDANNRPCRHAILRDEQTQKFLLFSSYDNMRDDKRYKPEVKHFHEIVVPDTYRRVFFDIDRDQPFTMEEIVQIQQVLTDAIADIYNIKLDNDEFAIYTSQKVVNQVTENMDHMSRIYINMYKEDNEASKGSVHLIARHLMLFDHIEHKALYDKLEKYLKPMRKVYPWIEHWDKGTCKSTQNLRCPGSYKLNSLRKKTCLSHPGLELFIGEATVNDRVVPCLMNDEKRAKNDKKKKQAAAAVINDKGLAINGILEIPELKEILGNDYAYDSHDVEFIKFKRLKKVKCMFCNVTHDKDDWLYARISTKGIYVSCLRASCHCDKNAKKHFKMVKTFTKQERAKLSDIYTANLFNDIKNDNSDDTRLFDTNLERKVFHDRFINDFEDCRALYVKAAMKMGKTQKIIRHIKSVNPKYILWISFRITYTLDIIKECAKEGNDITLANYMDIDGLIDMKIDGNRYLVIQYDSLNRLERLSEEECRDLMVIMDESESIIQQMNSLTTSRALENYEQFDYLIAKCNRLICMDANLGERTHMLIKNTLAPNTKIVLHEYTHKNMADHTAHITCNEGRFIQNIIDYIKNGGRATVVTNSRKYADKLYLEALKHKDKSKIMKYAGNDGSDSDHIEGKTKEYEKHQHLSNDINKSITDFDLVIMTTTFTAGVSITAHHFKRVYGYFMDRSADVLQCTQLLGRIRDIGDKEMYLCFKPARSTLPTNENDIFDMIDNKRFAYMYNYADIGKIDDVDTLYNRELHKYIVDRASLRNRVTVHNLIERYKSRNYFGMYMLQVLRRAGISIKKMFNKDDETNRDDSKDALKEINNNSTEHKIKECEEILKANITNDILNAVKRGDNNNKADDKETINAYKKASIMVKYDLSAEDMAKLQHGTLPGGNTTLGGDIMHELMQKTTQDIYKNLKCYYEEYKGDDETRAIFIENLKGMIQDKGINTDAKVNICTYLLSTLSYTGLDDNKKMTGEELNTKVQSLLQTLKDNPKVNKAISAFRARKALINVNEQSLKNNLLMINGFLQSTLGVVIKKTSRRTDDYHITKNIFDYNIDSKQIRLHWLADLEYQAAEPNAV